LGKTAPHRAKKSCFCSIGQASAKRVKHIIMEGKYVEKAPFQNFLIKKRKKCKKGEKRDPKNKKKIPYRY
jgi:hypothetical protein